jgi:deoxyribose-phosphate aldolase
VTGGELRRLIEVIADELSLAAPPGDQRCRCHEVLDDCCPNRLRGVVEAGATRVGLHAAGGAPAEVAALIDHTLLRADATRADVEVLCREAAAYRFAAVCLNPTWIKAAARQLTGSGIAVCSVVGFPFGATTTDVKAYEARRAMFDGACEIDMVINVGALRSGEDRRVGRDIEAVTTVCAEGAALSKVIIEAALLTDDEKVRACRLAVAAGADFVKTSTGFGPGGATVADVALMRRVVGAGVGVKAAGGVRDLESLSALVAAGASRIGASAGVRIVQQAQGSALS